METETEESNYQKLMEQRIATEMLGELTELQIAQLKYYPMLVSESVEGCETHFMYNTRELCYEIKINEKNKSKLEEAKKMMGALETWSQWLLGGVYLIRVKFNGKSVFKGTRKEEFKPVDEKELERNYINYSKKQYRKDKKFIK